MNIMIKIYYLHKGDDIPFYVGYTKHLKNRLNDHRHKKGNGVEMIEIDECLEKDKKLIETMYIQLFKSWGFQLENKNDGGGGPSFQNEESILKYKNWRKDKKPMLGKKQSEETKKRKSDALKGKPKPEGFGDMMREVRLGVPKPKGFGDKISKANKGKASKKAKTVLQYDLQGNFIAKYSNTLEAAAKTNSNSSTISKVCRGIFSQTNGYKWKYGE
jgi:group I intron endonuclease